VEKPALAGFFFVLTPSRRRHDVASKSSSNGMSGRYVTS